MEEDSVDECLQGNSVVDPLVPEQPNDSPRLAEKASKQDQTANA